MPAKPPNQPRRYPPLYEKTIPWILGVMLVAVVLLVLVALSVILGIFPGAG